MDAIADARETIAQSVPWQRSATLLALALACTAEYWTTASVSLTLTDLGGTLGASSDEASWALTIYTTAFAVAIALSHRLSVYFGNRKYLGTCALLYGLASIACAFSPNLPVFLSFRALQGFAGGVFLVRTFVFFTQRIEAERRASMAISFFIEVFLVGRIVPYVASGWLADNITWRLEFIVPALFMFAAAGLFFTFTADHWRQADNTGERVDVAGIVLLVLGATALQVVLSRGEIDDWFGSPFIRCCFSLGVVANTLFVLWQLSSKNQSPLLDLRYMKERSVYAGGVLGLALGFLLSGSLYVIPQYLRTVESHSALQTGVLLGISSAGAAIALWALQFMQSLVKRLGSRLILAIAFITAMLSECIRQANPHRELWIVLAQAVGVRCGSRWMDVLASPGRTAARYSRAGILSRRQVSTMERIAATRGPAFSCPMWVQLRRPMATGRMEFSARLVLSSNSGWSRKRVSLSHSRRV